VESRKPVSNTIPSGSIDKLQSPVQASLLFSILKRHYADYLPPCSITEAPPTGAHMHEQQLGQGRLSWPYLSNPYSEHTMHRHQSMQPIQIACHSCHSCHCFLLPQHKGFDLVNSTAPSPSSSAQTLPSNSVSYSHTTSYGFPHQTWPIGNNNDNNNWNSSEYWNH
jgi:hypothetical protein